MKYEQAFYTWGTNQLSRYKKGLGVCASSNLDMEFMDKCLALGADFDSEHTARTSEFLLYSSVFQDFVGVGVSPGKDTEDGRLNKLCHFFIPETRKKGRKPEEYILSFPYRREVEEGETLEQIDLEPSMYNYREILRKYYFDEEKLSVLLWKIYPVICHEIQPLILIIDRKYHEIEEDSQIARDMTWLLSMLVPRPQWQPDCYQKRLSCGVYTTINTNAVTLIITDNEGLGEHRFYLDRSGDQDSGIPAVFKVMASRAMESEEKNKEFLQKLLSYSQTKSVEYRSFPLLYCRWKLEKGEYVSAEEIKDDINSLLIQSGRTKWHWEFLLDYLAQEKDMGNETLIMFWRRLILPSLKRFSELTDAECGKLTDAIQKIISMMYGESKKNYGLFIRDLPLPVKQQVLEKLWIMDNSCIREDISLTEDVESFQESSKRYEGLIQQDDYRGYIIQSAKKIYENSNRQERRKISLCMDGIDKGSWAEYRKDFLERHADILRYNDFYAYREFLEGNIDKIEEEDLGFYYHRLLSYASGGKDKGSLLEIKKMLEEEGTAYIEPDDKKKFTELETSWDIQDIEKRLEKENLKALISERLSDLHHQICCEVWVDRIVKKLKNNKNINKDIFNMLIGKFSEVNMTFKEYSARDWKKYTSRYIEALWRAGNANLDWRMEIQSELQRSKISVKECNIWEIIDLENFESIFGFQKENNRLDILEDPGEKESQESCFRRRCYVFWKKVRSKKCISFKDIPDIRGGIRNGEELFVDLIEYLETMVLTNPQKDEDVFNFLVIQTWKEKNRISRKTYKIIWEEYDEFAELVLKCKKPENRDIEEEFDRIHSFFSIKTFGNVTRTNVEQAGRLWNRVNKMMKGIPEAADLKKGFDCVMEEMRNEYERERGNLEKRRADVERKERLVENELKKVVERKEDYRNKLRECEEWEKQYRNSLKECEEESAKISEDEERSDRLREEYNRTVEAAGGESGLKSILDEQVKDSKTKEKSIPRKVEEQRMETEDSDRRGSENQSLELYHNQKQQLVLRQPEWDVDTDKFNKY